MIVTATRRSENLQDVAQSVTALSTEDIDKQALPTLYDVVGALPTVNLVNAIPGHNNIIMRGISTGTGEYHTDSQVSVYLDDQPMTSISQQVDVRLIDIERVEVLPGPQGTLFGSSSQSGTIRYVTNKPDISGYSSQVDAEVGTTKGGERELRRQRPRQHSRLRQLRASAPSASSRKKAATSTTCSGLNA